MRTSAPSPMGLLDWLTLIALSVLWGGAFFFAKIAVAALPPLTLALCRVAVGALVLRLLAKALGLHVPWTGPQARAFLCMGLLNNALPFGLIFWGQSHLAAGLAAILNATTPLFSVLLAHWFSAGERLTFNRAGGVLLGLGGVALIVGPELSDLLGARPGLTLLAQIAVLGAALSYALAGLYGRRFRDTPPLITAAGQLTGSSLLLLPVALLVEQPWQVPLPDASTWMAVAALGVASTALAYLLYFRLLRRVGPTNLLLVTLLIPVSATLLGGLFLGEVLGPRSVGGMALIGLGLLTVDGRLPRKLLLMLRTGRTRPADKDVLPV